MCQIFDTHTHLNAEVFYKEEAEVIQRAKQFDVTEMAVVGCDQEGIQQSLNLAETYAEVYSIIGWHPVDSITYNRQIEQWLIEQLSHPRVVAMGEMGLDYYWKTSPRDVQEKVLRRQLAIAREHRLPVSIHNREATEDIYRILKEEKVHEFGGVMHSFNGGPEWLDRFLDLGLYVSFSGVVTYKNAPEVRESAKRVPQDRYLVETDAPYLAPVPKRGKQNEPAFTHYVVQCLANERAATYATVARQTRDNAYRLFGLKDAQ